MITLKGTHKTMALFNFTRAVEVSGNEKTGAVSTTYVSQASCPKECAFFNEGCYAESGMAGIWTNRLNKQVGGKDVDVDASEIALDEAKAIDSLTGQNDLRLHVVGDCRTGSAARIVAAAERFMGRFGRRVWSYTHAWRKVARSSWGKVSILASCETVAHVVDAMAQGYAAALVVDKHPEDGKAYKVGEIVMIPCPAQTKDGIQCVDCKLCWRDEWLLEAKRCITFEAHGSGAKKVRQALIQIGAAA
jgi:hypothetical protein